MIAGLVTFLVSGILHEWIIYIALDSPTCYEQLMFFCIQAIVISYEVIVQKGVRRLTGIDLANSIPYPVSVTSMVITFFAPLFMNPLIRERLFEVFAIIEK
jgi:hypothetical protein